MKVAEKNPTLTLRDINKLLVSTDPGFLQKKIVGVRTLMKVSNYFDSRENN